jgi:hypothetical protein
MSTLQTPGAATPSEDPSPGASWTALVLILASLGLAAISSSAGWWHVPFVPSMTKTANFALFAGFYVAAQAIERLLEVPAPLVSKNRANRAQIMLGLATLFGVIASFALGLYFLRAIGMTTARWIDIFASGLIIGAGTKPLHDLISLIQNK